MEERLMRVLRGVVYIQIKKDRAQNEALWHSEMRWSEGQR